MNAVIMFRRREGHHNHSQSSSIMAFSDIFSFSPLLYGTTKSGRTLPGLFLSLVTSGGDPGLHHAAWVNLRFPWRLRGAECCRWVACHNDTGHRLSKLYAFPPFQWCMLYLPIPDSQTFVYKPFLWFQYMLQFMLYMFQPSLETFGPEKCKVLSWNPPPCFRRQIQDGTSWIHRCCIIRN